MCLRRPLVCSELNGEQISLKNGPSSLPRDHVGPFLRAQLLHTFESAAKAWISNYCELTAPPTT